MPLSRRLVISPDDLRSDFDAGTIARGVRYAGEGRVRDVSWERDGRTLTGACAGSDGHVYGVDVCFEDVDALVIGWADCDCPVGNFCKHAVALLLTAASGDPQPSDSNQWRTVLAKVLDEMAGPPAGADAPIGLEFSLTTATRYLPGGMAALRPVTIGKRGTWIKRGLSWQRLLYDTDAGEFNRRQHLAVRELAATLWRSGTAFYGQTAMIGGASSALWATLIAAQDAGVAMVADKSSGLRAVELIKNAQLRLDFAADDAGGAVMSATLLVDGEPTDPGGATLIGRPEPHGMHQVTDGVLRLGSFDPIPGSSMLGLLGEDKKVHIPAENVDEVALSVLPRLAHAVPVEIEEGLFTPPAITGPFPVLTIKMTGTAARAYWSIRYDINDKHHDFDPDSAPQLIGYRDGDAEEAGWQRIAAVLRAVAAASGTWSRQAAQHVKQRMARLLDAAAIAELRAIDGAGDPAAAAAAASIATLRGIVDLTAPEVAVLCAEILPRFDCRGDLIIEIDEGAPDFRAARTDARLAFGGADPELAPTDWFDLNITVQVDGQSVPLPDVIGELASGATHMLLPSGVYFRLDSPELIRLRELLDEARALGEIDGDRVNARSLNVTLWDELLGLGVVDQQVARWRQNLARLAAARPPVPVDVPRELDATLRDYQRDGLDWLSFLWDNGLGGVLADDMGLGKTVQTLALIARAAAAKSGKFLVVAPTSVVSNWIAEAGRFTPTLTAVAVNVTDARSDRPLAELAACADIVVTSYTLLRIDFDAYAGIDWAGVILDEAQFVKNHNSKTHQCVRRLDAEFKLAITGTPMENNLMELWSLLSITVPGLFSSPKAFGDYFRKPIESGANSERLPVLRRRIKPVMLRRTKTQVIADLPPKQEQALSVGLGVKHRKIYDTRLARERQKVLGLLGDWEKNRFRIFRSLTLLRQLALHPGLVDASDINAGSAKIDFKAGGFGLNLTEADYCFLCDPWWNPAAEAQAVDRTHRIGQTRPVTVYRLVSADTIEEKVVALQGRKRELFTAVMDDGELFGSALTASDVRELLK